MEATNGVPAIEHTSPPVRAQLSREEQLEIENGLLKIANIKMQADRLQADMLKANEMLKAEQAKLLALRDRLQEKYGIDITTTKVQQDGTIGVG